MLLRTLNLFNGHNSTMLEHIRQNGENIGPLNKAYLPTSHQLLLSEILIFLQVTELEFVSCFPDSVSRNYTIMR
jgi:hypothetical protein